MYIRYCALDKQCPPELESDHCFYSLIVWPFKFTVMKNVSPHVKRPDALCIWGGDLSCKAFSLPRFQLFVPSTIKAAGNQYSN